MKIICTDNFAREHISERTVVENVPLYYANTICDALNTKYGGDQAEDYFIVKSDDYKLYVFEP